MPKPEIFGLHENADITCDQNETYDLFATVLSLQPRVSSGQGQSREEVRRLLGASAMWGRPFSPHLLSNNKNTANP